MKKLLSVFALALAFLLVSCEQLTLPTTVVHEGITVVPITRDETSVTTTEKPATIVTTTEEPPVVTTTDEPVVITTTDEPVVITTTDEPVIITTTEEPVIITTTEEEPPVVVTTTEEEPPVVNVNYGSEQQPLTTSEFLTEVAKLNLENKAYSSEYFFVEGNLTQTVSVSTSMVLSLTDGSMVLTTSSTKAESEVTRLIVNDKVLIRGYARADSGKTNGYYISYNNGASTETYKAPCVLARTAGTSSITISGEHFTATGLPTSALNDQEIPFSIVADSGYQISSVKVNNNVVSPVSENNYKFTVVGDMTIVVETAVFVPSAYVTNVEIVSTTSSILQNQTLTLTAIVSGDSGCVQTVEWSSSDELTATVSDAGIVTPLKEGTVTITATTVGEKSDSTHATDTITITITSPYGTIDAPLSVENALELLTQANITESSFFEEHSLVVSGLLSKDSSDKFWLGGSTSSTGIQLYGFSDYANYEESYLNDTLVVQGYIKRHYNNVYEFVGSGTLSDNQTSAKASLLSRELGTSPIIISQASSEHATINNLTNLALNGTTITFTLTIDEGYELVNVKANNGVIKDNENVYSVVVTGTVEILVTTKEAGTADPVTSSNTIANLATAYSWANGTPYLSFKLEGTAEGVVTVSAAGGGNAGKYYTSGNEWRLYNGGSENPDSMAITLPEGYKLVSVRIEYVGGNNGTLLLDGVEFTSGSVDTTCAGKTSLTFTVGNTSTGTSGQAKITAIEVVYIPKPKGEISAEDISVAVGDTEIIIATSEDQVVTYTYEVEDPLVASVDANGVVTGLTEGTTTITITNSLKFTKTINVTVFEQSVTPPSEPLTITYSYDNTKVTVFETSTGPYYDGGTLSFTLTPENGYSVSSVKAGTTALTAIAGVYSLELSGNVVITIEVEEEEINHTFTATFPLDDQTAVGSYTATFTGSFEGYDFTIFGLNNNQNKWDYVKGGKKNEATTGSITVELDFVVESVSIHITTLSASVLQSSRLVVYSNYGKENQQTEDTVDGNISGTGDYAFELNETVPAGCTYVIEFSFKSTGSNGNFVMDSITYTQAS